jgi:tyrosine-protein phosphatase SIW14
MPRNLRWLLAGLLVVLLVGAPWSYARYRQKNYRNFHPVRADVLYRSGQMSLSALQKVVHDYGIKTVITLRDATSPPAIEEENFCLLADMNYHRFPVAFWHEVDGVVSADDNVRRFLEIMDDPKNHPVLVHCFAGSHRTGAFVAIYRMEYEHWTNADALDEMKEQGYEHLAEEEDIRGYLTSYSPRWQRVTARAGPAK